MTKMSSEGRIPIPRGPRQFGGAGPLNPLTSYPDALCSETLAALAMAALLWRHCKSFAKPSQWLLSGIALPLWQSIRKKALKLQWLRGHCIAIFLGMKLLWWFCEAIVRDYAAIAMVLRSHCNGLAEKADRCLFCMVSHLLLYYCWVDYAVLMYWVVIYHTTI